MSTEPSITDDSASGPSPRAVALARVWINVSGVVWLMLGIAAFLFAPISQIWLGVALLTFAVGHFVAARVASRRLAVFFAVFSP